MITVVGHVEGVHETVIPRRALEFQCKGKGPLEWFKSEQFIQAPKDGKTSYLQQP
jgi:hypothetical protein